MNPSDSAIQSSRKTKMKLVEETAISVGENQKPFSIKFSGINTRGERNEILLSHNQRRIAPKKVIGSEKKEKN